MESAAHEGLERLRVLLKGLKDDAQEAVGLLLAPSGYQTPYEATPRSALVFASTGGDGVHFSLIPNEMTAPENWPVVMTVPMQFDRPNLVVGANLPEFLGLGLKVGYFGLEQLAYDFDGMIRLLDRNQTGDESEDAMASTLQAIAEAFSISPWREHRRRLQWLQQNYPQPVEN